MTVPPTQLQRLAALVDDALTAYLDRALPRVLDLHPSLAPLTEELRAFVTGGKRLRPALLLLGYEAAGGREVAAVMGPALALELLHTCALLHDDIIDAAPTRRGRPTAHRVFAEQHAAAGWAGDAGHYGASVGILLGDLAFVQADELFIDADVPAGRLLAAMRRFTTLREEVMAGQYIDLYAATSRQASRELALAVATYKSGRYSVARPLEIGACLAGAEASLVEGLARFGGPLGRAFQIGDDLLGVFGQEAETGKSAASDLVEGKRTLLVAETVERLDDAERAEFLELLGNPALNVAGADRCRQLMRGSGGLAATRRVLKDSVDEALDALAGLPLAPDSQVALEEVAAFMADRRA